MYSGATPSDTVHVVPVPVECINSSSLKLSTDDDKDEVKNPSFLHAVVPRVQLYDFLCIFRTR